MRIKEPLKTRKPVLITFSGLLLVMVKMPLFGIGAEKE